MIFNINIDINIDRYLDSLVGKLPAAAAVYRERSPIHFVDRCVCVCVCARARALAHVRVVCRPYM